MSNSLSYESSNSEDLENGKIEADILDLGGDATKEESSKLRNVDPKIAVLESSFGPNEKFCPTSSSRRAARGLVEIIQDRNDMHAR